MSSAPTPPPPPAEQPESDPTNESTDSTADNAAPAPAAYDPAQGPIVAKAGSYFRNARYLMVTLIVGMGIYFGYDGFFGYPKENKAYDEAPETKKAEMKRHSDLDIIIQRILCFTLPPVGIALLAYWLRKSRGEVRLDNGIITMPGHPPFSLDDVTSRDKRLWDRKGIAFVAYQTADGKSGKVTLDDFIYERKPIDQIYDAIESNLKERASQAAE